MQEKGKERMQHMHAARLKLERKALVALPPCCIAESLKNPKESDGDGWTGWGGDPRYMTPPDLCSPRPCRLPSSHPPLSLTLSHADAVTAQGN